MWLACHTQEEIAEAVGCSVQPVKDVISDITANLPENLKSASFFLDGYDEAGEPKWKPPNISWYFGHKSYKPESLNQRSVKLNVTLVSFSDTRPLWYCLTKFKMLVSTLSNNLA